MNKQSNNCKKTVLNVGRSRSSKLDCETHGVVSCKEPCVKFKCSVCKRPDISKNKNSGTVRRCIVQEQASREMGDNEMIDFKHKRHSYHSLKKNQKVPTNPQKLSGRSTDNVLDQSVDIIPTRLRPDQQVGSVENKVLPRNDSDSESSKQMYPIVKRTTWDCILREQNIDLNKQRANLNSKINPPHKNRQQNLKPELRKSDLSQTNKHVDKQKCESACCLQNMKINTNSVDCKPPVHDTQCASVPKSFSQQRFNNQTCVHCSCLSTNPVLTLDLLVKELREKLQKQADDDDLQRIILDMENALSNFPGKEKENCAVPQPEEFKRSIEKKFDIKDCKSTEELNSKLAQSCQFLENIYDQLHEAGKKHKEEKERLMLNLLECRRLLAISKSKEKEQEKTIKELKLMLQDKSCNGDQHLQTIHELTLIIGRLQEEIKCIAPLKASHAKLDTKCRDAVAENERLNSQLQLLSVEKEKLTMLMQVKDKELQRMKQNFEDIKIMFGNHVINLEDAKEPENLSLDSTILSVWDKESDEQFRPICSSPTSSIPGSSPSPYNSWQAISSIVQKPKATLELKQGIKDLFAEMKKETKELNPNKLLPMPANYVSGMSDSNGDDGPLYTSIPKLKIPADILESDLSS